MNINTAQGQGNTASVLQHLRFSPLATNNTAVGVNTMLFTTTGYSRTMALDRERFKTNNGKLQHCHWFSGALNNTTCRRKHANVSKRSLQHYWHINKRGPKVSRARFPHFGSRNVAQWFMRSEQHDRDQTSRPRRSRDLRNKQKGPNTALSVSAALLFSTPRNSKHGLFGLAALANNTPWPKPTRRWVDRNS